MKLRPYSLLSLICIPLLVACGSDSGTEENTPGAGGVGGKAGAGGSAGKGAGAGGVSGGSAGSASGAAGSAGKAGGNSGGSAGKGGNSGGSGGNNGGSGGNSAGKGGSAGSPAGSGGQPGGSGGNSAGSAGSAGGDAGSGGNNGGSDAGGSAGSDAGGSAGSDAGGSAGNAAGGSAGADAGGSAGSDAGGSAGSDAGGSAGSEAGGSAGSDAGGSAGSDAGGSAGNAAGGSAGSDAGGAGGAGGDAAGSGGSNAAGSSGGVCGDGTPDAGEECDDGNKDDTDGCLSTCKLATCGDGLIQAGVEECDDGNQTNFDACTNGCKNAKCGDAILSPLTEECDDGNADDTDACLGTCKIAFCGDGVVQAGAEECDDANQNETDGCTSQCKINLCGNGVIDNGEQCDGALLNGADCAIATGDPKKVGTLACGTGCQFDITQCKDACVTQNAEATLQKKPVDIIFVIDNSGSMTDEIISVQNNINNNFAAIIGASGLDYRIVMLSDHGSPTPNESICISAPLSGHSCSPVPNQPTNTAIFHHYSNEIDSYNSLQKILNTYSNPTGVNVDDYNLFPQGWKVVLRDNAVKIFVEITDDNSSLASSSFDTQLLAKSALHFGTAQKRNYIFHSIVGVPSKADPAAAYEPTEPVTSGTSECSTAVNKGTVYQELSRLTGGLRFPVCNFANYNTVFNKIAQGIIDGATVACDFPIPNNPDIDPTTLQIEYLVGGVGVPQVFDKVVDVNACAAGKFYLEGQTVKLCPTVCSTVQADNKAKINVVWGCKSNQ